MNPEKRFYLTNSTEPHPHSQHTIFVDGTAGNDFREGVDIELSHWIPNRTLDKYKAGTSTEICFKFLEDPHRLFYDLVVNNHLDIDGLLSVFVLAYPTEALRYKDILCDASKTGDFWAWSEGKALKLFQELTLFYQDLQSQKVNLQEIYERCFVLILHILHDAGETSEAQTILNEQVLLIDQRKIQRHEIAERLVTYYVPKEIVQGDVERFLAIPRFNEPISKRIAFWPQVRNRLDAEKLQLVAIETLKGIHYDFWYPGYSWADTKGLWRPLGLSSPKNAGEFQLLQWPELSNVMHKLNRLEPDSCIWCLFPGLQFSRQNNSREFPIVAATLNKNNEKKESQLSLGTVLPILALLNSDHT